MNHVTSHGGDRGTALLRVWRGYLPPTARQHPTLMPRAPHRQEQTDGLKRTWRAAEHNRIVVVKREVVPVSKRDQRNRTRY